MSEHPINKFLSEIDSEKDFENFNKILEEIDQEMKELDSEISKLSEEEQIEESVKISTVRVGKKSKRAAVAGRSAINVCKKKKEGLYNRYKSLKDKFLKAKKEIQRACGREGMRNAKRLIN